MSWKAQLLLLSSSCITGIITIVNITTIIGVSQETSNIRCYHKVQAPEQPLGW